MLNKTISGNTVEVTCICSSSAFVAVIDVFKKKLVTHMHVVFYINISECRINAQIK